MPSVRWTRKHWAGLGYPDGLRGEEIPLLARIVLLAQTLDGFHTLRGSSAALAVAHTRSGTWFDPQLVRIAAGWRGDAAWWRRLQDPSISTAVVALEPRDRLRHVDEPALDGIASAFAEIIDAKSPYTYQHSAGVSSYAVRIARRLGFTTGALRRIARAGWLHDIGKLGVSNRILDKPGPLTSDERRALERHPVHTFEILSRVAAFSEFSLTAALHHEKLDGSGYPWRQGSARLDLPARILTAADMYDALTAHRSYRAAFPPEAALTVLRRDVASGKLDARVVDCALRRSSLRDPRRDRSGASGGMARRRSAVTICDPPISIGVACSAARRAGDAARRRPCVRLDLVAKVGCGPGRIWPTSAAISEAVERRPTGPSQGTRSG